MAASSATPGSLATVDQIRSIRVRFHGLLTQPALDDQRRATMTLLESPVSYAGRGGATKWTALASCVVTFQARARRRTQTGAGSICLVTTGASGASRCSWHSRHAHLHDRAGRYRHRQCEIAHQR
jgi:hypothetical protein